MKLIRLTAFIIILTSCSNDDAKPAQFKNYVLVHGAWQAPYAWNSVKTSLEKQGNKVTVIQLPGHGDDQTPPGEITLDRYKGKVIDAISAIDGKVILVGHSLGGMIISSAAEAMPEKIEKLIYVAAYLPATGQTLNELAHTDPDSHLGGSGVLIFNSDGVTIDVKQDQIIDLFIQDGTTEIQNTVLKNYRSEPLIPFVNPVSLTTENFGSVEKVFIKTLKDHVVSPSLQDRMITSGGVKSTYKINTGHSPFLSQPDSLTTLLIDISHN